MFMLLIEVIIMIKKGYFQQCIDRFKFDMKMYEDCKTFEEKQKLYQKLKAKRKEEAEEILREHGITRDSELK